MITLSKCHLSEGVNSWKGATHEYHKNWVTANSNDSTLLIKKWNRTGHVLRKQNNRFCTTALTWDKEGRKPTKKTWSTTTEQEDHSWGGIVGKSNSQRQGHVEAVNPGTKRLVDDHDDKIKVPVSMDHPLIDLDSTHYLTVLLCRRYNHCYKCWRRLVYHQSPRPPNPLYKSRLRKIFAVHIFFVWKVSVKQGHL